MFPLCQGMPQGMGFGYGRNPSAAVQEALQALMPGS